MARYLAVAFLLGAMTMAMAAMKFQPQPAQASAEETALEQEVLATISPTKRVRIAQSYLERFPDDVPLGRYASDILYRSSDRKEEAIAYLRDFAASHPHEIGPQYYYARLADDTLIWEEKARWALAQDSTSNWAWLMWMAAEWGKRNPNLDSVIQRIERSVALDPSRPEGYSFLGDAYAEQGRWDDAISAYEAGLVAEPNNGYLKQRLDDAQERIRKKGP